MVTTYAKEIILEALFKSRAAECTEMLSLSAKVREKEIIIDVLDTEIERLERLIEKERTENNTKTIPIPKEYSPELTWSDKIAFVLFQEKEPLTSNQIAARLRALDDTLMEFNDTTLVSRISATVGVNRQIRFEKNGKRIKLKKAELTAS